ncbi:hypothetical protein [Amycolatopsis azurea]|uniref:Uncharacterized protein n=1 Tax=Amycolatopsis azurea DSM 43854 TaxID=1238180 RepID=M2QH27_9PSEU|nr:hypothetical protein [Amycolatopsis azurea]EMD25292.1 hypothetical protein C791_4901 [Amycolatopsis azurea DSM 43854]OOC02270.1 hypothetical protein B0293_33075 [Amycolatopsis azurea DSM 43854]
MVAAGGIVSVGSSAAAAEGIVAAVDPAEQQEQAELARVRRIALRDYRPEVTAEAWHAILSSRRAEAIREFLDSGYQKAKNRAADTVARNTRYIEDVNRFSISGSAVRATSSRVLRGSDSEKGEYVQSGLTKAQELDRINDNRYEEKIAAQTRADRDYVAELAAHDPGPQVRAAAERALSVGDDVAIGLFFKYYWASAAKLDDEAFRRDAADLNALWQSKIRMLTEAALAAEKAERESSGELARKARADAIAAWRSIDDQASQSSVDWAAERDKAATQAAAWAEVAAHARTATTEQDWATVIARAEQGNTSWADEAEWAVQQAGAWQAIAEQARANAAAATDRDRGDQ